MSITNLKKLISEKNINIKSIISAIIIVILIPTIVILGIYVFDDRQFILITIIIAVLGCIPFFLAFENAQTKTRELVIIAVLTALTVVGRLIFAPVQGFKPVTAMVIITALCLGSSAGFLVGSLSALTSSIYFMFGSWVPFQMFTWGFLGFFIGLFHKNKHMHKLPFLIFFSILGGVIFSLVMDIWTVLSIGEGFEFNKYFTAVFASLPFMGIYVGSNIAFCIVLFKPISKKLERIKQKYMLFDYSKKEEPINVLPQEPNKSENQNETSNDQLPLTKIENDTNDIA